MDFIVKLLFLGGKYISQAAGRTILEIYYRSKELGRHMSIQYEKASEIIKPYDNMLELLNDRAREESTEDDIHLAFMNDEMKKQLEEHLKHIPMKIKSEQINELCKNDATSTEINKESKNVLIEEPNEDTFASVDVTLISKECEYDKMFTDLCKDLSDVTIKNFSENNSTSKVVEFPSMNIAFKTSQTYEVQESLKTASEIIKESIKDEDLKPVVLEDLERKINASNIEVFQFNSSPKDKDETRFNMEYLKKYQKSGQNPLSSLYSKDASYMKYLVDQSPSNSYFNTNAIRDKSVKKNDDVSNSKEQSRSNYVSDMQLPKNNFFNADEVIQINNRNIISGLHEEIENRMILLNKNKEHFKDFESKLHDSTIKTTVKQTTKINNFDNNLESKLKRSTNANLTVKRPLSSGSARNSKSEFTKTRNELTKLLNVNEKEFQKLERKVTQQLIRYGLNNADVMKIKYKEIRRPFCKHSLSNTDKEEINEKAKIMEVNNKVFEKFEKDMRNIVILEKNKQLDEEDKLISDDLGKYHLNLQKFRNQYIYDDDRRDLQKMDKPRYINVHSDFPHENIKSECDKSTPSYSLKCNLSSEDVEDIRERAGILETNAKAFDIFERRVGLSAADGVSNNKTCDSDFHSTDVMKTLKDILDNSRIFKPPKSIQTNKNTNLTNRTGSGASNFAKCRKSITNDQNIENFARYKSPEKKNAKECQILKGIGVMQEKSRNLQEDFNLKKQEETGGNPNENCKQNLDDVEIKRYITKKHAKFAGFNSKSEDKTKECNVPSIPKQTEDKVTKCKNQQSTLVCENNESPNNKKQEEMQFEKKKKMQKKSTDQAMSAKTQVTTDNKSREAKVLKRDPIPEEKAKDNNQMKDKGNLSDQLQEGKIRSQDVGDKVKSNSAKEIKDIQCSKIPRIQPVQKILHDCQNTSETSSNTRGVKAAKSENNIEMSENRNVAPDNKEGKSIKEVKLNENTNNITNKRSVSVPLRTYENKTTSVNNIEMSENRNFAPDNKEGKSIKEVKLNENTNNITNKRSVSVPLRTYENKTTSVNNIEMSENRNVAPDNKEGKSIKELKLSENTNNITNKRSVSVPLRTYENKTTSENNIEMSENRNVAPDNKEGKSIKELKLNENANNITNKRSVSVPLSTYENKTTSDLLKKYSKSHNKSVEHIAIKTTSRISDDKKAARLTRSEKVEDEKSKNYSKIQNASLNILQALATIEREITPPSKKDTSKVINQNSKTIISTPHKRIEDKKVDLNIGSCDESSTRPKSFANNMETNIARFCNRSIKSRSKSSSLKFGDINTEIDNYEMLENMPKRKIENAEEVTRQVKSTSQLETFSSQSKLSGKNGNLGDAKTKKKTETKIPTYIPRNKKHTSDSSNVAKPTIKTQELENNENKHDLKNTISRELKNYKSPKVDVHKSKSSEAEIAKVLESIENLKKEKQSDNQTNEATHIVLKKALQLLQALEHLNHTNKSLVADANVKSTIDKGELTNETGIKHQIPSKMNKNDIKLKQPGIIAKLCKGNTSNIGGGEAESGGSNSGNTGDNRGGDDSSDGVKNISKIRLKKIIAFVPADEETLENLQKRCDKDDKTSINEKGYSNTYKKSAEKNFFNEVNKGAEKLLLKSTHQDVENKTTNVGAIKQKFSFMPLGDSSEPKNDRSSSSRLTKQNDGTKLVKEDPNYKPNINSLDKSQNKRNETNVGIKSTFSNSLTDRTVAPVNETSATQYDIKSRNEQKIFNIVKPMNVEQTSAEIASTKHIERNQPLNIESKKTQPTEKYKNDKTQNQTSFSQNEKNNRNDEFTKTNNNIKSELKEQQLVVNQPMHTVKLDESENQPPERYIDYKVLNQMRAKEKEELASSSLTSEEKSKSLQASATTAEINTEDTQSYKEKVYLSSMSTLPFRMAKFSFIPLKTEKYKNPVELQTDTTNKQKDTKENVFQEKRTKVDNRIKLEEKEPNEGDDVEFRNLASQVSKKVITPVKQNLQKKENVQKHMLINENIRRKVLTYFSETERERKERLKSEKFFEKLRKNISLYSKIPIKELNHSTTSRKTTLKPTATASREVKKANVSEENQIGDKNTDETNNEIDSHKNRGGEVRDESETEVFKTKISSSSKPKILFREAKFLFMPLKTVHYVDSSDDVGEEVEPQEDMKDEIIELEAEEADLFPEAMSPLLRYFMRKQLRKKVYKDVKLHEHHVQEDSKDLDGNLSGAQKAIKKLSYIEKQQKNVEMPKSQKNDGVYERYPLLLKYKRNTTPNKIPMGALEWKTKFAQQKKLKQRGNKNVEYPSY